MHDCVVHEFPIDTDRCTTRALSNLEGANQSSSSFNLLRVRFEDCFDHWYLGRVNDVLARETEST